MTYKLLIVDDSKLARMAVVKALSSAYPDWRRVEAGNAADALKAAKESTPDIALVDFNMPERDGLALAADLRALQPDMPDRHHLREPSTSRHRSRPRARRRVLAEACDGGVAARVLEGGSAAARRPLCVNGSIRDVILSELELDALTELVESRRQPSG